MKPWEETYTDAPELKGDAGVKGPWSEYAEPAPEAPKPREPSALSKIGSDIKGTVTKLASDVARPWTDQEAFIKEQKAKPWYDISRGGQILGDIANVPAQVVGSPIRHLVSEPVAKAGQHISKAFPTADQIDTALAGARGVPKAATAGSRLAAEGVQMTPGQMAGGIVRRGEEALKSVPIVGSAIRAGEARSIQSFNRAGYNRVLADIGKEYPKNGPVGYDGIAEVHKLVGEAYDAALPGTMWDMHGTNFGSEIGALARRVGEMPPPQAQQFTNIFSNRVMHRIGPNGTMDGATWKQVDSELAKLARDNLKNQDGALRQLGEAINDLREVMFNAFDASNPQAGPAIKAANSAYAKLIRLDNAAARTLKSEGVFTPTDLMAGVRKGQRTGTHAQGRALLQDFARDAMKKLPGQLPDSGTTERRLWTDLASGGATYMYDPNLLAGVLGAAGLYTRPAQGLIQGLAYGGAPAVRAAAKAAPFEAPALSDVVRGQR